MSDEPAPETTPEPTQPPAPAPRRRRKARLPPEPPPPPGSVDHLAQLLLAGEGDRDPPAWDECDERTRDDLRGQVRALLRRYNLVPRVRVQPRAQQLARLGLILVGAYDRLPAAARQLRQAVGDYRRAAQIGGRTTRASLLVSGAEAALRYLLGGLSEQPSTTAALNELIAEMNP